MAYGGPHVASLPKRRYKDMEYSAFIGIDVSKKTIDASIFTDGARLGDFPHEVFENDKQGFRAMLKWVRSQKLKPKETLFGFEFTGYYSDALDEFMGHKQLPYTMIRTTVTKHYERGLGIKNDRIDSAKIADYLFRYNGCDDVIKLRVRPSESMQRLRKLKNERKFYVQQRTGLLNREHVTDDKDSERRVKRMIKDYDKLIHTIEEKIMDIINSEPDLLKTYKHLMSVPCIGFVNAVNTIANTQNFAAFENARQYAKYVGVAPGCHTSGTSVHWRSRPDLRHDGQAKADLSMAVEHAVEEYADLHEFYERKTRGKDNDIDMRRKALNAVKFKLIQYMFAVAKRKRDFAKPDNTQKDIAETGGGN